MENRPTVNTFVLPKAPTGIKGLDEITGGGLPYGRPTLVCGGAGCGKTLFATEFLIHGILDYHEPGVFVTFEETREELTQNVASLGFNLTALIENNQLIVDHINIDRTDAQQTGDYDLGGLFVRLDYSIQKINAKRVVLDTIEVLFGVLGDTDILRTELRRLFRWLKERGVTTVITGEKGSDTLTRHGIEEYVSDCVILLDHRVENQITRRRMRIVKYRGALHGNDEYPFLIDTRGFSILPITSVGLDYPVSDERISSGIPRLDTMLGNHGFFRASTILVSGPSGTGKTSIAAAFIDAACRRGERCMYFSFEEAASQIVRNMRSIGIDLQRWVDAGLLRFKTARPTMYSLEMHLAMMHNYVDDFKPHIVVMDPVTNFDVVGSLSDSRILLTRLIDFLKIQGITALMTSLTRSGELIEQTEVNISSMIDTWILVHNLESNGERNRILYILKSRGMPHSNQISEFEITPNGVQLVDTYLGISGVLTGSARIAQEAREHNEALAYQQSLELKRLQSERKHAAIKAQIAALQAELDIENSEIQLLMEQEERRRIVSQKYADSIARKRMGTTIDHPVLKSTAESPD